MVQLLNLPRDKIEAIISLGIFVFLYTLYVEIVYGNTDQSFFVQGWAVFISKILIMILLYLSWFYGSRIITNYIYYFNRTEK